MVSNNLNRDFHRANTLIFQETQRKAIRLPSNLQENVRSYTVIVFAKKVDILKFSVLKYADARESA